MLRRDILGALLTVFFVGCHSPAAADSSIRRAVLVRQAQLSLDSAPALTTVSQLVATDRYVFVGQSEEQEIVVYTVDGRFVRRIGRLGSGPGEFRSLRRFGLLFDTLWTIDWDQYRLSKFSLSGDLLDDRSLVQSAAASDTTTEVFSLMPEQLTTAGEVLGWGGVAAHRMSDGSVTRAPIVRYSLETGRSHTIGSYDLKYYGLYLPRIVSTQPIETVTFVVYDGAGQRACIVERDLLARDGVADVRVTCLTPAGDTAWQQSISYEPIPLMSAETDSVRLSRVVRLRRYASEREIDAALYIPTHWPPVSEGLAGADSRIWLRGPSRAGEIEYVVLDADGDGTTRISVPKSLRVLWADSTTAWAQALDEYDVPTVVRFSIEPLGISLP